MKVTKTYTELQVFDAVAANYLVKKGFAEIIPNEGFKYTTKNPSTKLVSCLKQVLKQLAPVFQTLQEELDIIRIMNCAVDPTTKVQLPKINGVRQYTIEGELNLKKEVKHLLKTHIALDARISPDINYSEFTPEELVAFSEIVIEKTTPCDTD